MRQKLIEFLKKLGVNTEEKKQEIEEALKTIDDEPNPKVDPPKSPEPKSDSTIDILKQEIAELKTALIEEKTYRDKVTNMQKQKAATEQQAKVDAAVNKLFQDKKITEAQKADWLNLFNKDYEGAEKIAMALPAIQGDGGKKEKDSDAPTKLNTLEQGGNILDAIKKHNQNPALEIPQGE